jgi:hypothetical protein
MGETLDRGSSEPARTGKNDRMNEHKWDLVDAVASSPLLGSAQLARGTDLAEVEQELLDADELPAGERERLIAAVRELAEVHDGLSRSE